MYKMMTDRSSITIASKYDVACGILIGTFRIDLQDSTWHLERCLAKYCVLFVLQQRNRRMFLFTLEAMS